MTSPAAAREPGAMSRPSAWHALGIVSLVFLAARLYAATVVGFGDSEALYVSYGLYPAPVYLDHPGLVGVLARVIGAGATPTPLLVHAVTSVLATLAPFCAALAARAAGASWRSSVVAAFCICLAPETAIGLFALTPDLPLLYAWYGTLAFAAWALRAEVGSSKALLAFLGAGASAGLAFDAKVSGALLAAGVMASILVGPGRAHLRSLAPYAAAVLACVVAAPVVISEIEHGFPMLHYRLFESSAGWGLSFRNVGALLGGQLLYVGPPAIWGAALAARALARHCRTDAVWHLHACVAVATLPLLGLALLSRVAEPHWLAPCYLGLPVVAALVAERLRSTFSRSLRRWFVGYGVTLFAAIHMAVLTPLLPRLLGERYQGRFDLANDLYIWPKARGMLEEAVFAQRQAGLAPVVIGEHWVICAQLRAQLALDVSVGCLHHEADFRNWLPLATWSAAPSVLYVTDDRFEAADASSTRFDDRIRVGDWQMALLRGGRVARRVWVTRWDRGAVGSRPAGERYASGAGAMADSPASRRSATSSLSPGLGVVSSLSP